MQATFVQDGKTIDHTPSVAVGAGTVVVRGRLVGIANNDIPANVKGALAVEGVFAMVKKNEEIADGAAVYWDADGDPYTGTAGSGAATGSVSDVLAGFAVGTAAATALTVNVKLAAAPVDLPT